MKVEELLRIRRELPLLRGLRAGASWRAFRGLEPDFAGAYRRAQSVGHREAPGIVAEALAKAGSDEERALLERLRAAVLLERLRVGVADEEDALAAVELGTQVEGPEGRLPLRAALRTLRLEAQRGRRERLAEAIGQAVSKENGRRADHLAVQRERIGMLGGKNAAAFLAGLGGFDPDALASEAQAALGATEDAWRELLPWAAGRHVEEGLQPLPRGDLAFHDLERIEGAHWVGGLFPNAGLTLVLLELFESMGFDARRRDVRLDLEKRPLQALGAGVFPLELPARVVVSLSPLGTPDDWRELAGAFGQALALVSIGREVPPEFSWAGDPAPGLALRAIFTAVIGDRGFLRRVLQAPKAAADDAVRAFALAEIASLRRSCGVWLGARELWTSGASRGSERAWAERMAEATAARHDERLCLLGLDPALPEAQRLRGLALVPVLQEALLERCNEDYWRNPRTGPWLQGLFASGGAEGVASLGGAPSLVGYAKSLVARL